MTTPGDQHSPVLARRSAVSVLPTVGPSRDTADRPPMSFIKFGINHPAAGTPHEVIPNGRSSHYALDTPSRSGWPANQGVEASDRRFDSPRRRLAARNSRRLV